MKYRDHPTPIGQLRIVMKDGALQALQFEGAPAPDQDWQEDVAETAEVAKQLDEYFAGQRQAFRLPLAPQVTTFQQSVLDVMAQVPYGQTRTYKELALALDTPKASRAVGTACGANPIPIILPCHRILGSSGSLTGYAGGLPIKRFLLDLESGQESCL